MTAPLPVRGLHHIGRLTRKLVESRAFYRDILGFAEIPRPNFDFPGAWLFNYGLQIHLIVNDRLSDPAAPGAIETRGNHLAFQVENLDDVERRLTEHGVPFRKNVVPDRNIQQIFFNDPDGYAIECAVYGPTIQ